MTALICWISSTWRNGQNKTCKILFLQSRPEYLLEILPCQIYKKQFLVDNTHSIVLVKILKIRTIIRLPIVSKFKEITVNQKKKDQPLLHLAHHPWNNHFKKWSRKWKNLSKLIQSLLIKNTWFQDTFNLAKIIRHFC